MSITSKWAEYLQTNLRKAIFDSEIFLKLFQTVLPPSAVVDKFHSDNNVQHQEQDSRSLNQGTNIPETEEKINLVFPVSNALTKTDQKYFKMIQSEAGWGNFSQYIEVSELERVCFS